jgi:predicted transcriptional regulator
VRRSVDLDKPLDRRVQRLAAADGRSVANWLTRAIEREVIRQESLEPQS